VLGLKGLNRSAAPAAGVTLRRRFGWLGGALATQTFGPLLVLLGFGVVFSLTTSTFLAAGNFSIIAQQCVIEGTLAVGQTVVMLTAGIDLANGAITVLGTIIAARLVSENYAALPALLLAAAACTASGFASGALISRLRLPPFIVTLGMLGIVTAAARLYSGGQSFPVTDPLLGWTGNGLTFGGATITNGIVLVLILYAVVWYMLTQTGWGRHVYAIGNNREAARLVGIKVGRTVLSVYLLAGFLYGIGAWLALGRIPNADPNALQTANLDTITAVVIGGTSLFGGRGGVVGTLIGTLIVAVLRNGLTLMEIDPLWQDMVTGVLVILAVATDQLSREARMS
jgi:fructose transport system permease protein